MPDPHPDVASDSSSTRRHRAHQGSYRESLGWPAGPPGDARARERYPLLTNYLAHEHEERSPEEAGVNVMSDEAVTYTRDRLAVLQHIDGVAETDRLWRNLLSSQPLAFSIAGHLRAHPEAPQLFSTLLGQRVVGLADLTDADDNYRLGGIEAEWFPPAAQHTKDRSGFDIAALLELEGGRHLLLTIEVKYVDSFSPKKLDLERYDGLLREAGVTLATAKSLVDAGGSQFLRSVLLTDSVRRKGIAGRTTPRIDEARAVVLGRDDDASARHVVDQFAGANLPVTVAYWGHSDFFDAAAAVPSLAEWAEPLRRRYVIPT